MAVYSMTGYANVQQEVARTQGRDDGARLGLEVRSVNSRFLDVSLRLADELRQHESALRTLVSRQLKRGKVEVRAALDNEDHNTLQDPAPRLLQRLNSMQDLVRAWLPDAAPLTVADALRLCANAPAGSEDWGPAVAELAQEALSASFIVNDQSA